ncbi:MAG TPA: AMP-binding protein [Burkholderiales bacterium]|nr:AMP-binding protein [Burkholderiales bacterium]
MNGAEHLLGAAALARHAANIALISGDERISYGELARRVRQAAGALAALGVAPGDRVLLLMRDTPALAAAWLGCLWHGAVAIALNSQLSEDDLRFVRSDSGARLALVEDVFTGAFPSFCAALTQERRVAVSGHAPAGVPSWDEVMLGGAAQEGCSPTRPDDAAFWLYSSGTTGRPKGIIHTHKDLLPAGQVMRDVVHIGPGEKVLTTSRLFFAYGLEHALLGVLAVGATSVLHTDWSDVARVCALVAEHRPTAFFSVPSFYRRLLMLGSRALAPFAGVKHCFAAGERLPEAMVEQWRSTVGHEILSIYGMSETFSVAMVTPVGTSNGRRTGRLLPGVEARLTALEGHPSAVAEPGVLWLRHPALALGYANRKELTREQFRDGWFCTKDVFVRDAEGFYTHQGRADELVKVAGQWVNPGELEEAVLGEPSIAEAVCVLVPDADGFDRLALFVAPTRKAEAAVEAAARACEAKLPRHKRPKWIRAAQDLPRTATGKIQRFKLREILQRELQARA